MVRGGGGGVGRRCPASCSVGSGRRRIAGRQSPLGQAGGRVAFRVALPAAASAVRCGGLRAAERGGGGSAVG